MYFLFVLALFTGGSSQGSQNPSKRVDFDKVIAQLAEQNDCKKAEISVDHFEYHDFKGDGIEELVLDASTCMAGTGGTDVHSVFGKGPDGELIALPFGIKRELPLFGNRNFTLRVENGLLVAAFSDTSDREAPAVTISYKWDGHQFIETSFKAKGPFKTSYNCAKAIKEIERAICYSPSVAQLDVRLADIFHARLLHASPEEQKTVRSEQRKWLAERESKCTIYKWWVDCLTQLYSQRIAQLQLAE
jgi:uncharacterized protein YecT (DUF1311 family)